MENKKQKKYLFILSCVLLLSMFYFYYHKKVSMSSDSTTMFSLLKDWMQGNIYLKDWIVGTNNFFFTETIWCIPGILFGFEAYRILCFVPSIFYALIIVLCCYNFIWSDNNTENVRTKVACTAGFAASVGMIAYKAAYTLLNMNSHNGFYVFLCIEIFLILNYLKGKSSCLSVYAVIGLLMAFSDDISLMVLIAPVVMYALYCLFWLKVEEHRKHYLIIFVTAAIYIAAKSWRYILQMAGGLITKGLPLHLIPIGQLYDRCKAYINQICILWGYDDAITNISCINHIYAIIIIALLTGILLSLSIQFIKMIFRSVSPGNLFLWLVTVFNLGGVIFTDTAIYHRYIVPTYIFGTMLLFTTIIEITEMFHTAEGKRILNAAVIICSLIIFFCRLIPFRNASVFSENERAVAKYIMEQGYGNGYGDFFWSASLISCFTDFELNIMPVVASEEKLYAYGELIKTTWYEEKNIHYIIVKPNDVKSVHCQKEDAVRIIGEPDADIVIGEYELLYWNQDISKYLTPHPFSSDMPSKLMESTNFIMLYAVSQGGTATSSVLS